MSDEYVSGEAHQVISKQRNASTRKVTVTMQGLGLVAAAIVLCGVSFAAGVDYQNRHTKAAAAKFMTGGRFGELGQRRAGDIGQVIAVSSTSITVSNRRTGADKTYTIDSNTSVLNAGQTGSVNDIKTGDMVIVETSTSSSVTASRIILNPSFGTMGPGGQADDGPATTITQ